MLRKRKESLTANSPPQQQLEQPPRDPLAYAPDHPMIQTMEKVEAKSFLNSSDQNEAFSKLISWLNEHPSSVGRLSFRVFGQQIDEKFLKFKNSALKTQIMEGIQLIQKMETTSKGLDIAPQSQMNQFPFTQISHLIQPKKLWHDIKQNNMVTQFIKTKFNTIIKEGIRKNKITVANLISLLASIDAVPINYIPIVNFTALDESNEVIAKRSQKASHLTQKILRLQEDTSVKYEQLSSIPTMYARTGPEDISIQSEIIKNMLLSFLAYYNKETYTLDKENIDFSEFFDFIFHPNNVVFNDANNFLSQPNKDNYWQLFSSIVSTFSLEQNQIYMLYFVFSACVAPIALPLDIKYDGLGPRTEEEYNIGIEILSTTDPLSCLQLMQSDVRNIAAAVQSFTSMWKTVFGYIFDFTNPEITPPGLVQTRNLVEKLLTN